MLQQRSFVRPGSDAEFYIIDSKCVFGYGVC
jgi:hypothetical protein